ncbi:GNAT family N-acetyltransferase [Caballeronia insecticola]|uniref:Putative GCN5-related N-acetyltransferase n=1 Tax=Caballeronia insecticola TaxID=758793 RepID=R4X4J8_9BURK|nr:GNAT family N-acetyltransferase [Caballeronia insecticola]BAN27372.1 putative GCN5-related N-acetyltransferase [Caballeronia insecticola]
MPNTSAFSLRRLTPEDAIVFRDVRLEGLQRYPAAFGASYEDERDRPLEWFRARITDHAVFGGFSNDGTLAGVAGLQVPPGAKMKHKGILWGMYVRPSARGTGLAAALLDCVLEHARGVVDEVKLEVAPDNTAAMRLYGAAGFVEFAREPRALKIDGTYHDSVSMTLPFDTTGAA